ncbi:hypothetical protein [Colwellia sp. 75C3]|uniref:hypothetical protein n=1 Tax=Colwellia sp. 75C3 TaxID=888425 RepID=UPI000C33CB0E|nr:hypothetical protein [Colwellia sp. 75C3]
MQRTTKDNSKTLHITNKLITVANTSAEKASAVSSTAKQFSALQNCLVTVDGDTTACILGYN